MAATEVEIRSRSITLDDPNTPCRDICEWLADVGEYGEVRLPVGKGEDARKKLNNLSANMPYYKDLIAVPKGFVVIRRVLSPQWIGIYILPGEGRAKRKGK